MVDINMSLDDYAKATKPAKKVREPKQQQKPARQGATAGASTRGGERGGERGGRRGGGRQRYRSEEGNPEDTRKGRSDTGSWSHDKFEGNGRRGGRTNQQQPDTRAPGVHIQMVDVHFQITEADLQELFKAFTTSISLEFDHTNRPTGNVNLICENMKKAKALLNEYSKYSLDGHELKFRILPRQRKNSASNGRQSGGPDESRATIRIREASEARGRGRGRGGRGGRAAAMVIEKRADIKQKRDKKQRGEGKDREKRVPAAKPKTQMDLDAEMSQFVLKNATPDSLDAQMAQFAEEREAAAAAGDAAPTTEAAKAE